MSAANCCSNSLRLRSSLSAFVLSASNASDDESDFDAITSLSFAGLIGLYPYFKLNDKLRNLFFNSGMYSMVATITFTVIIIFVSELNIVNNFIQISPKLFLAFTVFVGVLIFTHYFSKSKNIKKLRSIG